MNTMNANATDDLFTYASTHAPSLSSRFDGATYDHERDGSRLNAQLGRVLNLMRDGQSRTLEEIARATGDPEASVSARLRDLRKPRFGGHTVKRIYIACGLFSYQLVLGRE